MTSSYHSARSSSSSSLGNNDNINEDNNEPASSSLETLKKPVTSLEAVIEGKIYNSKQLALQALIEYIFSLKFKNIPEFENNPFSKIIKNDLILEINYDDFAKSKEDYLLTFHDVESIVVLGINWFATNENSDTRVRLFEWLCQCLSKCNRERLDDSMFSAKILRGCAEYASKEILEEAESLIFRHASITLLFLEDMEGARVTHEELYLGLLKIVQNPVTLPHFKKLLPTMHETDLTSFLAFIDRTFDAIKNGLKQRKLGFSAGGSGSSGEQTGSSCINLLNVFLQVRVVAERFIDREDFLLVTGLDIENQSFLGNLLWPSPVQVPFRGRENAALTLKALTSTVAPDPAFTDFVKKSSNPSPRVQQLQAEVNNNIDLCVSVFKTLFKSSEPVKTKTYAWIAKTLKSAESKSTFEFRQRQYQGMIMPFMAHIPMIQKKLLSNSFGFNLLLVLLRLCYPIKQERISDLNTFYSLIEDEKEGRFVADDEITEKAKEMAKGAEFKFSCKIFWMTLKGVRVLLLPALQDYEMRLKEVGEGVAGKSKLPDYKAVIPDLLQWDVLFYNQTFLGDFAHFLDIAFQVIVQAGFSSPPLNLNSPLLEIFWTNNVPPQFAVLPCDQYEDLADSLIRLLCILASPLFKSPNYYQGPASEAFCSSIPVNSLARFICLTLCDAHCLIRNANFRLNAAAKLLMVLGATFPRLQTRVQQSATMSKFLTIGILRTFVEAQSAGYYGRIDLRLILTRELEKALGVTEHQGAYKKYEAENVESFERFIHLFVSNAEWLQEEAFSYLAEIKVRQVAGAVSTAAGGVGNVSNLTSSFRNNRISANNDNENNHADDPDNMEDQPAIQGDERVRNVTEMPLEELENLCQNLMENCNCSMRVLGELVKLSQDAIRRSQVLLTQMVLSLNSCLNSLVGPKCLTLKVANMKMYSFKPRELLAEICSIFICLTTSTTGSEAVIKEIAGDERNFSIKTFEKAAKILRREGMINREKILQFTNLVQLLCEEHENKKKSDEFMEGLEQDVPEEFLDPIMQDIMVDPVTLPSGHIMDRKNIERHLMSEEFDPFTRQKISKADLVPNNELKAKIQQFMESIKKAK